MSAQDKFNQSIGAQMASMMHYDGLTAEEAFTVLGIHAAILVATDKISEEKKRVFCAPYFRVRRGGPMSGETSKVREDVNEYGTPVSVHNCQTCGGEFTLCPLIPDDDAHRWPDCLSPECESYDPHRDADLLFMSDKEIANNEKPVSLKMLRARKSFKTTGKIL